MNRIILVALALALASPRDAATRSEIEASELPEFKAFTYWDVECRGGSVEVLRRPFP